VPGEAIAAWRGPDGESLVFYRGLPIPDGTTAMIAESLANRLENNPGTTLVVKRTETFGDISAARVEVILSNLGMKLPPTRDVTVGFVRPDATYFLSWQVPDMGRERFEPDIESTIRSVRFKDRRISPSNRY
jgi:hypothetical protein